VIAQLVDAETRVHLWAERYDRTLTDVFAVQDDLTKSIVRVLSAQIEKAEARKVFSRPPPTWRAYDCVLRGMDLCNAAVRKMSVEGIYEARRLFYQALAIDDKYARAYAMLSHSHHLTWIVDLDKNFMNPTALERSYSYARSGVDADHTFPQARAQLGSVLLWKRQHDESLAEFAKATSLNPQFFDVRLATSLLYGGEPAQAIEVIRLEMRRDPYYSHLALAHLGNAHFGLRRYVEAVPLLRQAILRAPNHRPAHVFLAATLAQLGLIREAREEAAAVLRIEPKFSIDRQPRYFAPYRRKEDAEHFIDGLRRAGLPQATN
jgi:adenylate cyclase